MTPAPSTNPVLARHYSENRGPIAFLDESYSADPHHGATFYIVSAVIVESDQVDPLRDGLDERVPQAWWHTTDELQTVSGRTRAQELLAYLADGKEACVVTHREPLASDDKDGEAGRRSVLCAMFGHLWNRPASDGGQVRLAVLEERRELRQRRADMATRAHALNEGLCGPAFRLVQVSPAHEHLLWLPDLTCSAYRRKILQGEEQYFATIESMSTIVQLR